MENPPHLSLTRALWRGCTGGFCPQRSCLQTLSQPSSLGRKLTAQPGWPGFGMEPRHQVLPPRPSVMEGPQGPQLPLHSSSPTPPAKGVRASSLPRPWLLCPGRVPSAPSSQVSPSPSHTLPGCPPSHAGTDPGLEASWGGCTFSHGPLICSANMPKCPWCALTLSWVWGWKQETGVRGPAPGAVSTSRPSTVAQSRTWLLRGRFEIHTGHKGPAGAQGVEGGVCAFRVAVCRALGHGATACYGGESCPFPFLSYVATSTLKPHMWL